MRRDPLGEFGVGDLAGGEQLARSVIAPISGWAAGWIGERSVPGKKNGVARLRR